MDFDLELDKAVERIQNEKARVVCVQLPDGLKPRAKEIVDYLNEKTDSLVFVWLGSCFGACDIPTQVDALGVDLLIQWGHSEYGL